MATSIAQRSDARRALPGHEIGGFEPLGEASVDRRQQLARLAHSLLSAPEPSEAHRGPQLPGESALPSRHVDGLPEESLGRGRGLGSPCLQDDLALDARQLGDTPELFIALRSSERLVDHRQALADLSDSRQPFGQRAEQGRVLRDEPGLAELVETGVEKPHSRADIAVLDEQHSIQTAAARVPDGQRVSGGMLEQHGHRAFGYRPVARPEGDQRRRLQGITQRHRVIDRPSVLDIVQRDAQSLIGESLEPQDARQHHARRHPLVVLKADGVRPVCGGDVVSQHVLEVTPCFRLVSQIVERDADHPTAHENLRRIGRARDTIAESFRLYQRGSTLAAADAKAPQAPERAQLILDVVQALGNLQGLGPRCGRVRSRPLRLHQRHAQCCEELHLAAVASSRARFEARQRAFDPPTTLEHQRLLEPQRHGSGGERHADRRIPA